MADADFMVDFHQKEKIIGISSMAGVPKKAVNDL